MKIWFIIAILHRILKSRTTQHNKAEKTAKENEKGKIMAKKVLKCALALLLAFSVFGGLLSSASDVRADSVYVGGFSNSYPILGGGSSDSLLAAKSGNDYAGLELYVGGMPFGVKFMTDGVVVTELCDIKTDGAKKCPAKDAGIVPGDVIVKINGEAVTDATCLTDIAEKNAGKSITVTYSRDGKTKDTELTPVRCAEDGRYKTGMYVKDSGAGIGTVTYVVPETMSFGGLGHGICDASTGKLIPMQRGSVVGVTISGVVRGLSGSPGEVRGYFSAPKTGTLLKNTEWGVFGAFATLPDSCTQKLSIGTKNELQNGKAYILSTLEGTTPQKYEIEISDIKTGSTSNKCFTVKVTDKNLIDKSGGIVQGMSGSPIIQNGKLVGAVTHVLINDPTTGYGIFIENMLNAAQMPQARAS